MSTAKIKPGDVLTWDEGGQSREGQVWSMAPATGTYWVVPTDGGSAILVRVYKGKASLADVVRPGLVERHGQGCPKASWWAWQRRSEPCSQFEGCGWYIPFRGTSIPMVKVDAA